MWGAAAWAPPAPETRQPDGGGFGMYPPPPAAATYPAPAYGPAPAELSYSPWWKRVVATLIDCAVIWIPLSILSGVVFAASSTKDAVTGETTLNNVGAIVVWLLSVVGSWTYYVLMEGGPGGATVGKLAMGIQVRTASTAEPIGYARAFGRRVMAVVFWVLLFLPGLLDLLWPLWDGRRQTWHDKVLGTVVVDKR
jgi:uncharacterized RDD family membrane protein YckC